MRKILLYVLGVLVLILAGWISYLLVNREEQKRPTPPKQVKTVFVDTVRLGSVPVRVKSNGNLIVVHVLLKQGSHSGKGRCS